MLVEEPVTNQHIIEISPRTDPLDSSDTKQW